MSYTPKVWERDELITSEALNNIENGLAEASAAAEEASSSSGLFIVYGTFNTDPETEEESLTEGTVDRTIDEIEEAWMSGRRCALCLGTSYFELTRYELGMGRFYATSTEDEWIIQYNDETGDTEFSRFR